MTGTYNREILFDHVRGSLFGGSFTQKQVEGIDANLDYIDRLIWHPSSAETKFFDYWNAYMFATDYHETGQTMQPIVERGSDSYLQGKRYYPYIGRGKVQMTWEDNYSRSDREIADGDLISQATLDTLPGGVVDQHGHMDQALVMEIAVCNLMIGCWKGWWTGHKLWDHLTNDKKDYWNARRIVNGTDRASDIAGYAEKFEVALVASWQSEAVTPEPPPPPAPMPEPPTEPAPYPAPIMEAFKEKGCQEIRENPDASLTFIYHRPEGM